MWRLLTLLTRRTRARRPRYSWPPPMAIDRTRTLRGALAGATAAAVWAVQQPLDERFFGVPYDDTELLGKWVTRRPTWRAIGMAIHVQNGAAFGALYANVAPSLPVPARAR